LYGDPARVGQDEFFDFERKDLDRKGGEQIGGDVLGQCLEQLARRFLYGDLIRSVTAK
jgi:hypothetical protein